MSARRLLVVTDEMEVGGSQRQISYLLEALDRSQWQPELLYFRHDSFLVHQLRANGITVHHIAKRGRLDPRFLLAYARLLRQRRFDVVHAFSLTAELWTLLASYLYLTPLVLVASMRGMYLDHPDWFWRIKRFVLQRSDAIISNSRAGAEAAAQRARIPLRKFDVIPNGIPPSAPLPPGEADIIRRAMGAPANRCIALFVGRLVKAKNLACLLRAMAELPVGQRPWVALAGNGPLRDEIEQLREQLGLVDDIRFLGERDDAGRLMKTADFLVLPSSNEGMSNVVMEAMECGCPVIASRVGGNPELIEDHASGLLFDDDDHRQLSALLHQYCSQPQLRARMASGAQAQVKARYSVVRMATDTAAVYQRCLSADAPGLAVADACVAEKEPRS
ncbi:glycosyltransferase [Pseudoxanthomonas dokdonensis]|uniref:glycosyltransferase n=1 Tax=Pseudoxanthomonas dokdonensis TaxID=344882 RepID=UPI000A7C04C8|nr:glycosyltransferase [Pseudoxanthomonas dokdonensis]